MDMDPDMVRPFVESVDGRWELDILANLEEKGPMGPGLLRRTINRQRDPGEGRLHHKVLDATLNRLLTDGLITKRVNTGFPKTVQYGLTDWGCEHVAALAGLQAWYIARLRARTQRRWLRPRQPSPPAEPPSTPPPEAPDDQ